MISARGIRVNANSLNESFRHTKASALLHCIISMLSRRVFLSGAAAAAGLPALPSAESAKQKEQILARIRPPQFPDRTFEITKHGAAAGADATDAIARAIAACSQAGGGTVLVPRGEFLTGPIHLKSNTNLHLAEG